MQLNEKEFTRFLKEKEIINRVAALAAEISKDYADSQPLVLPVLNGSFIFAADLIRKLKIEVKVSFVKHSSYNGGVSSGQLKTIIGLQESVFNQDVLIVEDIVDTGQTISRVVAELSALGTKSVEVVTLLRKKKTANGNGTLQPKYVGFEIPDHFVVGYGLDYDGAGRQLCDLYRMS